MQWTHHKKQESMRVKLKKLQTEISELRKLVVELQNSLGSFISKVRAAENKIGELEVELP